MESVYFSLNDLIAPGAWPGQALDADGGDPLSHLFVSPIEFGDIGGVYKLTGTVVIDEQFELGIVGIDLVKLVIAPTPGGTELPVEVTLSPFSIELKNLEVVARVDGQLLRPMKSPTEVDTSKTATDIVLGTVTLGLDGDGHVILDANPQVSLPLCMIGSSGVVVEGGVIDWLSPGDPTPSGATDPPPAGFTGLYVDDAEIHLPDVPFLPQTIRFDDCYVGTGGFTGRVSAPNMTLTWNQQQEEYTGTAAGELFGFKCGLKSVEIDFAKSALKRGALVGEMLVPYLDKRLGISLDLSLSGDFAVGLAAPQASNPDPNVALTSGGLVHLKEPDVLEAELDALAFEKHGDDFAVRVTGSIRPLLGGVDWPEVELKGLTVHSDGRVELGGGWLDLPQQQAAGFHGFPLELRKIGFGSDEPVQQGAPGKSWVGISGALKLIDGLPVGGSVDGLKLKWDPADPANPSKWELELAGIEIALRIPEVLNLDGKIAFFDQGGKQWFQGGAQVSLLPLGASLDAQLLVGRTPQYSFFYIFLEAGLPAGIPLFQTGLAIYGMGGLFGWNVKPDRHDGDQWYEGWYKRNPVGPTDASKWTDQEGGRAFGATLTIGTLPDNGFAFHGRVLLILLIPGPTILIEGKANIMADRKTLATTEPLFRTLAVIDGQAGTVLVDVEPHYTLPQGSGDVVDASGVAEAFFDFNHPDRWYLNLGVSDPRERRIGAQLVKLFHADAYVMLNQQRLALGGYVGFDQSLKYGPVGIHLAYWFEGDAEVVFRPLQFAADAGIHGRAELSAIGVSLALELDAEAHVKTPTPFEFSALIHVAADLPWPLPDPEVTIPYEYVEPAPPPLAVPLQNIEVATLKATESWDVGTASTDAKLVPIDGRPVLVFSKPMHDDAGVGGNIQAAGAEQSGDISFSYHLDEVVLEKLEQGTWVAKAGRPAPSGGDELYGMWLPAVGGDSPPATKLMLFSKTPFDGYAAATTGAPAEAFAEQYPDYPCVLTCADFETATPGEVPALVYQDGITIAHDIAQFPNKPKPLFHDPRGSTGGSHAFQFPQSQTLWIPDAARGPHVSLSLPAPAHRVKLRLSTGGSLILRPFRGGQKQTLSLPGGGSATYYTGGAPLTPYVVPHKRGIDDHVIVLDEDGIVRIEFDGVETDVFEICWIEKATVPLGQTPGPGTSAYNAQEAQRWADGDFLFDSGASYRVRVKTHVDVSPSLDPSGWPVTLDAGPLGPASITQGTGASTYPFEHEVYIRTDGPPGFVGSDIDRRVAAKALAAPAGAGTPAAPRSAVRTLRPYVAQTVPADGATAFYRAYDVAVEFNESYVDRMYADYGRDLAIDLRDRNGEPPATRAAGVTTWATTKHAWRNKVAPELTRAELQWSYLLEDAPCDITLPAKPPNRTLSAALDSAVMSPRMTYSATLRPDPVTGASDAELYAFSFTTSAYATFAHHIHSFSGRLWDSDALRDTPLPALTAANGTALMAAAQLGTPAAFDTIAGILSIDPRVLPSALEVTLLRAGGATLGFMVESPEPLPADRVAAAVRHSGGSAAGSHAGPLRVRDAALGDRQGTAYNDEWVELIATDAVDVAGVTLEHLASTGGTTYAPLVALSGGTTLLAGDLVRVHAGRTPTGGPPDDGIIHVYLTAANAQPAWMLQQGGDSLRVRDGDGRILSELAIRFDFTSFGTMWTWNADRTRAFMFPTTVTGVPSGSYRVEWLFTRDLATGDPGVPVLRSRGRTTAEAAVAQFVVA